MRHVFVTVCGLWLIALTATAVFAMEEPRLYLPLEGEGREIVDGEGNTVGLHYPTSIADQDDPESRRISRYRVEGRYDDGLRYFADDRSFTEVERGLSFDGPIESLAISAEVKLAEGPNNRFASLISTRTNSDRKGFALYLWGNQIRFTFGDGEDRYELRASGKQVRDGEWHTVAAAFDQGRAAIWVDGVRQTIDSFDAATISPPTRSLFLGGYPVDNKGRDQYAFDGWLDEVAIGHLHGPLRRFLAERQAGRRNTPPPPVMRMSVQPIDGNERFFGGRRVFHTFRDHPLPMTFLFQRDPQRPKPEGAALVLYLPEELEIASIYQSHHREPAGAIETERSTVTIDGRAWTRHATRGVDIAERARYKRGPFISVALAGRDDAVDEAPIRYALIYDGEERPATEAIVKRIDLPDPVAADQRGAFHLFGYMMLQAFVPPDPAAQGTMLDMLEAVGLTGKGRFYSNRDPRSEFDHAAKRRGFTLYEIALWGGPSEHQVAAGELDVEAWARNRAPHLRPNGDGEGVIFDYEPWGITYKDKSFTPEIREAFADRLGLEEVPDRSEIRERYRREWTDFWLDVSAEVYAAMSTAVKTQHGGADPTRIAYTYFFPYDDENRLYRRFWSVPKDPRRAEPYVDVHLISLYHTNERELVDRVAVSQKHLEKPIWGISAVSRVNAVQQGFTSPETTLSPARLEQKIVLGAAVGMEVHGLWPGRGWLDAKHLVAMSNASRFIWPREVFYFDGLRDDDAAIVAAAEFLGRDDWAYTAHQHPDGRVLVSVFNFTDRPQRFDAACGDRTISLEVSPHGYEVAEFSE